MKKSSCPSDLMATKPDKIEMTMAKLKSILSLRGSNLDSVTTDHFMRFDNNNIGASNMSPSTNQTLVLIGIKYENRLTKKLWAISPIRSESGTSTCASR